MSQSELAERSGLSLRTIQRIENDKNDPRGYTLKVLSEALSIPFEELSPVARHPTEEARRTIGLINLSALSAFIIPFGNLIVPIMLWSKYNSHPEIDRAGSRIVNFQVLWSLVTYSLLIVAPFIDSRISLPVPLIFMVLSVAFLINLIAVLLAAKKIREGNFQVYKIGLRLL